MYEKDSKKAVKLDRFLRCSVHLFLEHDGIIKKTFYTCSTESLFLMYQKDSKKAVKLDRFLQCSVHLFLEHDGCF